MHLLRGNPSKLRADQLRDSVEPESKIPACPDYLIEEAQAEWRRITPLLEKYGLASELDLAALAAYCQSFGRWVQVDRELKRLGAAALIDETPSGFQQMSALLIISQRCMEHARKFGAEFGLTPSARSRLTLDLPDEKSKDKGKAEEYFS